MATNLAEKFALITTHWAPKIIGQVNNFQVKAVKLQGEFIWHSHPETDELFLVHRGELVIEYRECRNIVRAGEFFVVPRGVEHRPVAENECEVLLLEPGGTVNTGDAGGSRTVDPEWL